MKTLQTSELRQKFHINQNPISPDNSSVKRNFRLGVLNGVLYLMGDTFVNPALVLVSFVSYLTQSPILLGLVVPLQDSGWAFPQLWVANYCQSQPRKMSIYRAMSVVRISLWSLLVLAIFLVRDATTLLICFFITYSLFHLASGISGLPFMEIVSKVIPADRRGEFFAWRLGLAGLASLAGSALVRWLLDPAGPLPFPYNFGVLGLGFLILMSVSLSVFVVVEEPPDETILPKKTSLEQIRRAIQCLKVDHNYQKFISMQSAMMIGGAVIPFFAVYVQQAFDVSKAMVGVYLGATMAANLLSNLVFGSLNARIGERTVLIISICAGIIMTACVLCLPVLSNAMDLSVQTIGWLLVPVFVFSGIRYTGISIGGNSMLLRIAPESDRSIYIGFYQTFLGCIILLNLLSGWVVSMWGYFALFIISLLTQVFALSNALGIKNTAKTASPPEV